MKKSVLFLLSLLTIVSVHSQQVEPLPTDADVRIGHLDNGLTYYIRHNELPKQRAEFHIAQAVGAILEEDNQNGLAHFLEHMAFNGTEHFAGKGIINYFESIGVNFGGNINAYTSLDETVYRLSEVPTYREGIIDSALLVMHDWSHSLLLEGDEIDAERGVIREEWRTRANAERRMWSKLNPLKYPDSQYAKRDVIGDTAVINNFTYDALRDYYHKWYGPDLQAIIVVGDVDVDQIEQKIKDLWADVPARENRGERPYYQIADNTDPIVAVVRDSEAQLTRIRLDFKKQQLPDEMQLTNVQYIQHIYNILVGSMLNQRLAEEARQTDAPFVNAYAAYGGIVRTKDAFISLATAKTGKETEAYQHLLLQLEKMHRYGFTEAEFDLAKKEILNLYEKQYNERNSVRNIQYTRQYIRHFLDKEPIPGIEWEYQMISQILPILPLEVVNQYAKELPTKENVIISFTAPERDDVLLPTEAQIKQMFLSMDDLQIEAPVNEHIDYTLIQKQPKAGKVKKTSTNATLGTTEWLLSNGIRVILKPTEYKQDEILLNAYSDGGLSMVDNVNDLPSDIYAATIVDYSGIAHLNTTELQKALTGKHVGIVPSINNYSEKISGESSIKDFETLLQLTYLYFTNPRKDAEAFETLRSMLDTQLKNKEMNHKAIFRDSVTLMASSHSPRTIIWNSDMLSQVSLDVAYQFFCERFADAADFTFVFTGNINPSDKTTEQLICRYLGGLKTGKAKKHKEQFIDRGVRAPKGKEQNYFDRQMQINQTTNRIQFTAEMPYTLANDLNMEVIGRILNMRYLESIREREGGTYGVGVAGYLNRRPVPTAILLMQFDTDPEKEARLMEIIYEEVNTIIADGPLMADLQKAKESMLKDFEENKEKNSFWSETVLNEYYRYGINYLTDYPAAVENVTSETIQQTLKTLVEAGNVFEVVMAPAH